MKNNRVFTFASVILDDLEVSRYDVPEHHKCQKKWQYLAENLAKFSPENSQLNDKSLNYNNLISIRNLARFMLILVKTYEETLLSAILPYALPCHGTRK